MTFRKKVVLASFVIYVSATEKMSKIVDVGRVTKFIIHAHAKICTLLLSQSGTEYITFRVV